MDRRVKSILSAACIALFTLGNVRADTTVTVNPGAAWLGFMNVWDLPGAGNYPPNLGGYVFGSGWGTADLRATFAGPTLTLAPNTIGDPDPFWYLSTGNFSIGNKIMDANMYVQDPDGTHTGITLTFTGIVTANTMGAVNPLGDGWTAVAFIKDFAPDFSSFVQSTVTLPVGVFSVSLLTINDPLRHVQYGFEMLGPCVWATDSELASYGDIQITAIPEPSSIGLALTGLLSLVAFAWKRRA